MNTDKVSNLPRIVIYELAEVGELTVDVRVARVECPEHGPVFGEFIATQRRLLVDDSPLKFGELSAHQVTVVKPYLCVLGGHDLPEQNSRQRNERENGHEKGLS